MPSPGELVRARAQRCSFALVALGAGCASASPVVGPAVRDIAGRWSSDCFAANPDQGATTTYDIRETAWQIDYVLFDDRQCTSRFLTVHIEGPYSIGAPSAAVPGAFEATFGFARKTITPHLDEAAAFLASPDGCGRTGFVAGQTADVSQSGCAGLALPPIASCKADFDLIHRAGDELRFGARPDDNDMCTAARRPASLEHLPNHRR